MDQIEVMMGTNVNSAEQFTNQENVLHMGRSDVNARKKSLNKLLLHQEGS